MCLSYGPEIDPDNRDTVDDSWSLEVMKKYVRDHFPGLDASAPSIVETCIITVIGSRLHYMGRANVFSEWL